MGLCMKNKRLHFVFAADQNFLLQLQVSVASLLLALRSCESEIVINVLDCGIEDKSWSATTSKLLVVSCQYGISVHMKRFTVDMKVFDGFQKWNTSRAAYARLLLPQLLSGEKCCVYADCDVLFLDNPTEIFYLLESSHAMVVGHRNPNDGNGVNPDIEWFEMNKEPYNDKTYFCSGLVGMNLDEFRATEATKHMLGFLNRHPQTVSVDQTALNWFCRNSAALLPDGWGVFPHECKDVKASAIHYAGGMPWHGYPTWYEWVMWHDVVDLWHDVAEHVLGIKTRHRFERRSVAWFGRAVEVVLHVLSHLPFVIPGTDNLLKDFRATKRARRFLSSARKRILALPTPRKVD